MIPTMDPIGLVVIHSRTLVHSFWSQQRLVRTMHRSVVSKIKSVMELDEITEKSEGEVKKQQLSFWECPKMQEWRLYFAILLSVVFDILKSQTTSKYWNFHNKKYKKISVDITVFCHPWALVIWLSEGMRVKFRHHNIDAWVVKLALTQK